MERLVLSGRVDIAWPKRVVTERLECGELEGIMQQKVEQMNWQECVRACGVFGEWQNPLEM